MKARIIFSCFLIIACFSFRLIAQSDKQKNIEEFLIGTWVEVPGEKENNSLFNSMYLAPDTVKFFKNNTLKSLENGIYLEGDWEIDKTTKNLKISVKYEGYPPVSYEYRFLFLSKETCYLEAADDEGSDDHEIFRIRMKKLPEK